MTELEDVSTAPPTSLLKQKVRSQSSLDSHNYSGVKQINDEKELKSNIVSNSKYLSSSEIPVDFEERVEKYDETRKVEKLVKVSDGDRGIHNYFSSGPLYTLRNIVSISIFLADVITNVFVAKAYYNDNHTNFSMTAVMILLSGELFMWWRTCSPTVSFYTITDNNKEFVFHSRDLKGDKAIDKDKDDSFWYCTQSSHIRFKQRSDTTLYRLQGLIFVGKFFGGLMMWLQTVYIHNYGGRRNRAIHSCNNDSTDKNNKYCGSFYQIYYIGILLTSINYSYNLWLSSDFQSFLENGTLIHWLYCDIFKYFLFFEIFLFKNINMPSGTDYFLIVLILFILITLEIILYLLLQSINSNNKLKLISIIFIIFYFISFILFIVSYITLDGQVFKLVCTFYCSIPSLTLLSLLYKNFVSYGLENLKGKKTSDNLYLYSWLLSSETGKLKPKEHQTYNDIKNKVLAFNYQISQSDDRDKKFKNYLNLKLQNNTLHKIKLSSFYEESSQFFKHGRPVYMKSPLYMCYSNIIKPQNHLFNLIVVYLVILFIVISRILCFLFPFSLFLLYNVKQWKGRTNGFSIVYYVFYISSSIIYIYYLKAGWYIWHIMNTRNNNITLYNLQNTLKSLTDSINDCNIVSNKKYSNSNDVDDLRGVEYINKEQNYDKKIIYATSTRRDILIQQKEQQLKQQQIQNNNKNNNNKKTSPIEDMLAGSIELQTMSVFNDNNSNSSEYNFDTEHVPSINDREP